MSRHASGQHASGWDSASHATLTEVLVARGGCIRSEASRVWRMPGSRDTVAPYWVALRQGRMHLEAPLPCPRAARQFPGLHRALQLLHANACLPANMCYAIGLRKPYPCLVSEVALQGCLPDASALRSGAEQALVEFERAAQLRPKQVLATGSGLTGGLLEPLSVDDPLGEQTRALCRATGWEFHERGNGQLAITLDVPRQFCQVHAYQLPGSFRLAATLESAASVSDNARCAMSTFLLTASRLIRWARATVVAGRAGREYRWEVAWPQLPDGPRFDRGLAALSIACRLTCRELQTLCDPSIASTYLSLRRRSLQ